MSDPNIKPHKIEKPFQLLAAWFIILFLLTGVFVTGASTAKEPAWLAPLFGIAAVVYPAVVFAIVFVLQTVFRPALQPDEHYASWLRDQHRFGKAQGPPASQPKLEPSTNLGFQKIELELKKIGAKVEDLIESGQQEGAEADLDSLRDNVRQLFEVESSKIEELEERSEYIVQVSLSLIHI